MDLTKSTSFFRFQYYTESLSLNIRTKDLCKRWKTCTNMLGGINEIHFYELAKSFGPLSQLNSCRFYRVIAHIQMIANFLLLCTQKLFTKICDHRSFDDSSTLKSTPSIEMSKKHSTASNKLAKLIWYLLFWFSSFHFPVSEYNIESELYEVKTYNWINAIE